jgi:hypothetical protein
LTYAMAYQALARCINVVDSSGSKPFAVSNAPLAALGSLLVGVDVNPALNALSKPWPNPVDDVAQRLRMGVSSPAGSFE